MEKCGLRMSSQIEEERTTILQTPEQKPQSETVKQNEKAKNYVPNEQTR